METEQIKTLMTVKGVERCGWDVLHEVLLVELVSGPPGVDRIFPAGLTREGAKQLHAALRIALSEIENEDRPMQ